MFCDPCLPSFTIVNIRSLYSFQYEHAKVQLKILTITINRQNLRFADPFL